MSECCISLSNLVEGIRISAPGDPWYERDETRSSAKQTQDNNHRSATTNRMPDSRRHAGAYSQACLLNIILLLIALCQASPAKPNTQQILSMKRGKHDTSTFMLRSIHNRGLDSNYKVHRRLDVAGANLRMKDTDLASLTQSYTLPYTVKDRITTLREHSHDALAEYHEAVYKQSQSPFGGPQQEAIWVEKEMMLPNISDRGVVLTLASMTANCYTEIPHTGDWIDVDDGYNSSTPFGWEHSGLRGHVFTNNDNSSVVIAFKGTSVVSDTAGRDKRNDNLLFSCCCARVSYLWRTVCDCYEDTYTCNMTCLENELRSKKAYYRAALDIYHNVTSMYPKSNILMVGHSLGGAIASLVAQTYALPAVTFQAPGERLAAKRLGLPVVPGTFPGSSIATKNDKSDANFAKNIWSFGHTADPLYMGTCGGITSLCWSAGFAMETHCHSGLECVYDVVNDLGWRQGINTHRILNVIHDVISKYNSTPTCVRTDECVDCFNWNG